MLDDERGRRSDRILNRDYHNRFDSDESIRREEVIRRAVTEPRIQTREEILTE